MSFVLNIFPELLTFSLLAPLVLRVVIGYFFLKEGFDLLIQTRKSEAGHKLAEMLGAFGKLGIWYIGLLEIITGALLVAGLYTQGAAIAGMVIAFSLGRMGRAYPSIARHDRLVYRFVFFISFALLFLGAGAFAIDYPL